MAFSTGNDINILQATDAAVVGAGLGDDIYLINASSLAANQSITISDVNGANIIKLIGGVTISSNIVAETTTQLILSNGAVINILAADTFSYELAGDAFSIGTGQTQNYNDFATKTLGVSTLPTGSSTVAGHTNVVINTDGSVVSDATTDGGSTDDGSTDDGSTDDGSTDDGSTDDGSTDDGSTVQGSEFSLTPTSVIEGNSGTTNLAVTITRTGDTTAAASVNLSTSDSTAKAGEDYTGVSNEVINFAAGQSSATFNIVVSGDITPELDETFTAILSSPSSGSSIKSTAGSASLTITNDDDKGVFTLTKELSLDELAVIGLSNNEYGVDWIV